MVSEPLLWPFLSSLVFISVTPFSPSLPPSQQPPQPLTVEPPTSSNRRPWVLDLQSPLRSFTFHRPLPFASPLQILLRLRLWRYHWDCLAPIYILVEPSTPSKIARAIQRFCSANHAPSTCHCTSGFSLMRLHVLQLQVTRPSRALTHLNPLANVIHVSPRCVVVDVTCLRQLLTSSFDYGGLTIDFSNLTVDFNRAVDFFQGWLFQSRFSLPGWLFHVDFIFSVCFCILYL